MKTPKVLTFPAVLSMTVDVPDFLGSVQLPVSAILGTAHLLRKVLCL